MIWVLLQSESPWQCNGIFIDIKIGTLYCHAIFFGVEEMYNTVSGSKFGS